LDASFERFKKSQIQRFRGGNVLARIAAGLVCSILLSLSSHAGDANSPRLPTEILNRAKDYLQNHASQFGNHEYLAVADMTRPSKEKRLIILHLPTGQTESFYVAHGKGSDPNWNGLAQYFSNVEGSQKTSTGFYRTAEQYQGKYGLSLRLDGLSQSNSNARERAIVLHGAIYVSQSYIQKYGKLGRTWGCPGVDMQDRNRIIGLLKNHSLLYIWGGQTHDLPRLESYDDLASSGAAEEIQTTDESEWSADAALFTENFSPR
jgi:hypothetical protein